MKVRNITTGLEYFIRPENAGKVGDKHQNVPVYHDIPPLKPGCHRFQAGNVIMFQCSRKSHQPKEDHDKLFKGNWLELVQDEEADN